MNVSYSVTLTEFVDQDFGRAMIAAWGAAGANPNAADAVTALVDKYVSQPSSDPWWRPVLTARLGSR